MTSTIEKIKELTGIGENQKKLLETIVELVTSQLSILIEKEEVPAELDFIVVEVSIIRYNRRKNEGMTSYSQDGESITFAKNDFDAYMDIVNRFKGKAITGEVWGY
ncbi:phage head-tail connector protein [Carnobacterium divergens]|uniref:phage head-tail connector protein n=1 Tax=Carnobacterium divergens TaxID=2748 RepID=UPI00288F0201|nr:phage head-tail connector protein [Carnobacterium divergens]MDT1996852.1 phage head-tail connector protein [Carnobacterium divergens]